MFSPYYIADSSDQVTNVIDPRHNRLKFTCPHFSKERYFLCNLVSRYMISFLLFNVKHFNGVFFLQFLIIYLC